MKEINIDRVYPLNRHHNIKILHDFNPLKSFTLSNASLDLHLSRSLTVGRKSSWTLVQGLNDLFFLLSTLTACQS